MSNHNSLKSLSKRCANNKNIYVKKNVLVGYTSELLNEYITDYIVSVAHTDRIIVTNTVRCVINDYSKLEDNQYIVFKIQYRHNNSNMYDRHDDNCQIELNTYNDYDTAFTYIHGQLDYNDHQDMTKTMYIMVRKLDESLCHTIHDEIYDLTTLRPQQIKFKPTNFNIRLWVHVKGYTNEEVIELISKLEKNNNNERYIKATYNEPAIKSMMVTVSDYKLLARLKLTNPWIYSNLYKVHYGMRAIEQKIKEKECL